MKCEVNVNGQKMEGTEVGFQSIAEPWTELACNDGTTIRLKVVPTRVIRVDGLYDAQGNPVYNIELSAPISVSTCPLELRKKA